jgi:Carboxypeptidase regulatory-like domain/TonB-dependent Receptor Plug Domain
MRIRLFCGIVMLVALFAAVSLLAQDTASLNGTVTDATGAAVANAQVLIDNSTLGIHRSLTTNQDGEYSAPALSAPSAYDITVIAKGFKKYEAKGVLLRVAEKSRVNISLQVGASSAEVTVQGSAVAQVETESSDLGNTVTGKEITQLELNGRDVKQLITLVPGVSNQTGADEGGVGVAATAAFSVNGGRTEYNNWEIDGGDSMDNGSNSTLNVTPSIDSIAEFKVLTSNYGAQYGRNASGTVEIETKSGTSAFHGDLFEFLRNDAFNAVQFGSTTVPEYKKNDFGFTIGGPVYIPGHYNASRQKTFFFWSEEWRRDLVPATNFFGTTLVPTMANRNGDFSDQCAVANNPECPVVPSFIDGVAQPLGNSPGDVGQPFVGNQVPIEIPAVSTALTALIPQPNQSSGNLGTTLDQWFLPPTLPTHFREELFRIDHNVNDKIRANFRYIHDSWDQTYPVPLWTNGTSFPTVQTQFSGPGISLVARVTDTVSPTLLNEFVASYTTDHITTQLVGPWARPSGFPSIGVYDNGFGGKVPGIALTDGTYNFGEDPGYVPNGPLNSNPTVTLRDNLTKIVGTHNFQAGAYIVIAHKNEIPQPAYGVNGQLSFADGGNGNTNSSGNAYADLLLGNISGYTQEENAFKMHEKYHIFEPYFQDDWHATKRLTVNLGLRLSFFGTYSEENHLAWNFDPSRYVAGASGVDPATGLVTGSIANPQFNGWVDCGVTPGVPDGCMSNHWFNPAPRIGFAFDPLGNGKWAIRGGYGIFFEHTNGNESNTESLEPYNINTQTTSIGQVSGYENINPGLLGGGTTPLTFVSLPNHAIWPYVQQWHFDVQHDIGKGTLATVSYVGSAGVHLTRSYEYNQMKPVPLSANPYGAGQVITMDDCNSVSVNPSTGLATATANVDTGSPVTTTGSWANNLAVACGYQVPTSGGSTANLYRPYIGIGGIERKDETGSSNYNALEISVRHSIGGLELSGAYTYSHSIDDSSDYNDLGFVNSYNLNAYRASSNFDERHNIDISYVYDVPFEKGKGLASKLLGGWQWSGIALLQSGSPFSVYNTGNSSGTNVLAPLDNAGVGNTFATGASYPDVISNPKNGVQNSAQLGYGPLLYNPSAFVAPRGLTFGDAGRNILNNPWRTNFDMALLKHFAITESKYFEFRAEAFNVFNHTEFAWLGGDAGSAADNGVGSRTNANQITCYGGSNNSAGDPTCSQASTALFRSSGAHLNRILQLALKFVF